MDNLAIQAQKQIHQQLSQLDPERVVTLDKQELELEPNYTLNLFPQASQLEKMAAFIEELKEIEPDQYFVPLEKLHITILGKIDISIDQVELIDTIKALLSNCKIRFQLKGAASNFLVSSITAYPQDFSFFNLREEIRKDLGIKADNYSAFINAYEYVGWINYMRYKHKPSQKLVDKLKASKDRDFGVLDKFEIRLLKNTSRLLEDGKYEVVEIFN